MILGLFSLAITTLFLSAKTTYHTEKIDGLNIFYREAGSQDKPTILLLHGFPTSSHMFRNLMPLLSDDFHLIAPDYPGYGNSSMPLVSKFNYTFDNIANLIEKLMKRLKIKKSILYVVDYGAPVGFRLAVKNPKSILGLIVQNGNAYEEGLDSDFWKPLKTYWKNRTPNTAKPILDFLTLKATKSQYLTGARSPENISPDNWNIDQPLLDRPGNSDVQLQLFYDYRTNLDRYPAWHRYFRQYQPPTLIVWGKNDVIFPPNGAYPYRKDLKDTELHLLNTGHFALEEDSEAIARCIKSFFCDRL